MIARLYRIVPLLVVLALVAAIVYVVAAWRYSPTRAKEILIRSFTVLTGVLTALFVLASLYALLDGNRAVLELTLSFAAVAGAALVVTRVCRSVFVRNHPSYRDRPVRATVVRRFPWDRWTQGHKGSRRRR